MPTVIVQSKYCYDLFLKCIRGVMTMVCCFGCFNKSGCGWLNCDEKMKKKKRMACVFFHLCVCVCGCKTLFKDKLGQRNVKNIIFRLRGPIRGQAAGIVGFCSTTNLHIISNLHSTGNVINYTVKMILWILSKHGHWLGTLLAFVRPFDSNYRLATLKRLEWKDRRWHWGKE